MIRNLKALGLALVAVLAMSAVAASTASAGVTTGKITSDGPVTLHGVEDGTNFFEYPGEADRVECTGSTFTGHSVLTHEQTTAGSKHQLIASGSTEVTITPHYNNAHCTAGTHTATVTMNGCDYRFYDFTTTAVADQYSYLTDIVCPPNKDIEVHIYFTTHNSFIACSLTIKAQTGITGLLATNETDAGGNTTGTVTLTGKSENIKASKSGLCGSGETTAAKYEVNVTASGKDSKGKATPITITH